MTINDARLAAIMSTVMTLRVAGSRQAIDTRALDDALGRRMRDRSRVWTTSTTVGATTFLVAHAFAILVAAKMFHHKMIDPTAPQLKSYSVCICENDRVHMLRNPQRHDIYMVILHYIDIVPMEAILESLDDLPSLAALPTMDRHAVLRRYAERGQHFAIEYSPSGRAKCRFCQGSIAPGALRLRHLVCGRTCFTQKRTGKADACGRWHVDCFIQAQTDDCARFLHSNIDWEPVRRTAQLAGFPNITSDDQMAIRKKLYGDEYAGNATTTTPSDDVIPKPTRKRARDHHQLVI